MSNHTNPFGIAQINIKDWEFVGYIYLGTSQDVLNDYAQDVNATLDRIAVIRGNDHSDDSWDEITFHANHGCAADATDR